MWRGGGPDQIQKDVRTGDSTCWWTWNGENRAGARGLSRAWNQSTVLSNRGERSLFDRSEEDRGVDGKLSESHW